LVKDHLSDFGQGWRIEDLMFAVYSIFTVFGMLDLLEALLKSDGVAFRPDFRRQIIAMSFSMSGARTGFMQT
jgi:hypothetical protein